VTSQQSNLSRHRTEASPSMGAWQGPLANGWHQQPKAVTRRSTANIAQLNQGSPSQTLRQRLRVALCTRTPHWPSLLELPIRSDVVGTLPSGILGSRVSPQRIAPIARARLQERGEHQGGGTAMGLGWPPPG